MNYCKQHDNQYTSRDCYVCITEPEYSFSKMEQFILDCKPGDSVQFHDCELVCTNESELYGAERRNILIVREAK